MLYSREKYHLMKETVALYSILEQQTKAASIAQDVGGLIR